MCDVRGLENDCNQTMDPSFINSEKRWMITEPGGWFHGPMMFKYPVTFQSSIRLAGFPGKIKPLLAIVVAMDIGQDFGSGHHTWFFFVEPSMFKTFFCLHQF